MRVKVTFYIEADDPAHKTGITQETYDEVTEELMKLGGEDYSFEKEEEK